MQTNHISNQYQHVQTIKTLYNTNQKASKLISTSIQTKKPQNQTKKPQHVQTIQTLYNTNTNPRRNFLERKPAEFTPIPMSQL